MIKEQLNKIHYAAFYLNIIKSLSDRSRQKSNLSSDPVFLDRPTLRGVRGRVVNNIFIYESARIYLVVSLSSILMMLKRNKFEERLNIW